MSTGSNAAFSENTPKAFRRFRRGYFWLLWLLFIAALAVRVSGLGAVPVPHDTEDEYFYLWSGLSMLRGEVPTAWSLLNADGIPKIGTYNSTHPLSIVRPALDHPPVYSLLTGAAAYVHGTIPVASNLVTSVSGEKIRLEELPAWQLRMLPLLLFAASFWLMWKWLHLTMGPAAAMGAMVVFSFLNSIVIHQRLSIADNFITPCLLSTFLALELWRRGRAGTARTVVMVAISIGLAGGAKLVALALMPAVFAWSASRLKGRRALLPCSWAIAGAMLTACIVIVFGLAYGMPELLSTMRAQSTRFYDLGGMYDLIRHNRLVHEERYDPLLMGGWLLAMIGCVSTRPAQRAVFVGMVGYLFGYSFFAPVDAYGWYVVPLFPFLCAAWGMSLRAAIAKPSSALGMVTFLLLATNAMTPFLESSPELRGPVRLSFIVVAIFVVFPWGFRFDDSRRRILSWMSMGLLLINIAGELTRLFSLQLGVALLQ